MVRGNFPLLGKLRQEERNEGYWLRSFQVDCDLSKSVLLGAWIEEVRKGGLYIKVIFSFLADIALWLCYLLPTQRLGIWYGGSICDQVYFHASFICFFLILLSTFFNTLFA